MSMLPNGWTQTKLGKLTSKIGSGATPRGGSKSYKQDGIPLVRSMNVHFDGFHPTGLAYIDDEQAKQLANVEVKTGDILLNITGASIGRVTIAPQCLNGARVNQHVSIIRLLPGFEANYIRYFLASPEMQRFIQEENYGVTRQALTKGMIEDIDVPLPPLAEQSRIVAKLDSLFARTRRARAELARIPPLVEHYKQAILAAAFHDAESVQLSEVTDQIQYGYIARSSHEFAGPRYLRITDIQNGGVNWEQVPRCIIDPDVLPKYRLVRGDIVFARSGATVGKSLLITDEPGEAVFASYLIRVRCTSGVLDPEYAALFFQSTAYWDQIYEGATGTGQPNFNGTKLGQIRIPVQSIDDQRKVVAVAKAQLLSIRNLLQEIKYAQVLLDRLETAYLSRAFRGELVPQDPNDEPAAALLERIRSERVGQSQNKGKSRQRSLSI